MNRFLNNKIFWLIFLLSILFFVALIVSFSFPDLFALFYVPNLIDKGNIYTMVNLRKPLCPWLSVPYPPLYYLIIGGYLKIIQYLKFLPDFLFKKNNCPVWELILNKQFLFWVKLPYLIFHLLAAWVFCQFFDKNREKWFLFWLLNPLLIFVSFIIGQYEILPIFFLLLAIYFCKQNNRFLTFLSLGIAGALKNFPFLLIFPFLFLLNKNFKENIISVLISIIPYILSILVICNKDCLSSNLSFSENIKMLDFGFFLGDKKVSLYIIFYLIILLNLYKEKIKSFEIMIKYILLFTLLYFLTTFWFPQRILWLIPVLLLVASRRKKIFDILPLLYLFYFLYVLILYPGLFDQTLLRPVISNIKAINYNFSQLINLTASSLITGLFVWIGYQVFKESDKDIVKINKLTITNHLLLIFIYFGALGFLYYLSVRI